MLNKSLLAKILLAAILLVAVLWLAGWHDLAMLISKVLGILRSAGAVPFFLAMTLLPAAGAPLTLFTLTAGPAFGPQLGMPMVILFSLASIAANMSLTYALARRALRPILERLLRKLGYRLPQLEAESFGDLILLVRVTPGIPFPVQNYLLGLAAAPFARYLVLSSVIAFPLNTAIIVFGDALLQGRGRTAMIGFLSLAALIAAVSLLRRSYARKSASQSTCHPRDKDDQQGAG